MTPTDIDILLERLTSLHSAIDMAVNANKVALDSQTVAIAGALDRQTAVLRQIAETLEREREGRA